ncbi:MAG: hypothetical protein B6D57_01240 [Candidatus Coatesbacteria bacterium 4484_99]|uniref:Phosphatidic acid phosphatase type 2/haloperoxidase domain-containing protein n=1 Tax=Candidatus Coatesbacteria bacterium 4484_99 TaxID=1970774 RepID=A0A1W9S2Y6_9BACT|nr:MAG: hypothetical protein B6D57_01240 [Candidatus Coatesbacteria bacterium 4484_99]RLC39226.1 MAG: hypothetical protein DRH51_07460 [Candidatus Coatesbacteria bacterium]RLC40612.1 MAG: hypothetical protein DRH49_06815 [Candidatus Coatesbacteria bacterium]RLC44220.1 MAG: hypothetical protein DRH44_03035 [Candidatus Coatesbacteria bacterium]
MLRIVIIFFTFIALLPPHSISEVHIIPALPEFVLFDAKSLITSPLNFSSSDWLYAGLGATTVALSMPSDRWVRDEMERGKPLRTPPTIRYGDIASSPYMLGGIPLGMYLIGEAIKNDDLRLVGIEGLEAVILSVGISMSLKFLIGRERPLYSDSPFHICGPHTFSDEHLSMPSTQTTAFSALATVIVKRAKSPPLLDLMLVSCGMVGVSRMWHSEHWLSDIVFGSILGYSIGRFIVKRHDEGSSEGEKRLLEYDLF